MAKFWRFLWGDRPKPAMEFKVGALTPTGRASAARQALNNEVFNEAIEELVDEAVKLWMRTAADDMKQREFLWRYVKAINQLRGRLERYISDALFEEEKFKRQVKEE